MNNSNFESDIVIDFQILDKPIKTVIQDTFIGDDILESNAFSGTELVTVILTSTVLALDKVLNFYVQNRKSLKEATIKIGKDEIELSGFSNEELNAFVESGSIAKIKEQMGKNDQ
jgi:hypothetical protein